MSVLNTLFGIETESERQVREHNEGQKDGSQAGSLDKISHRLSGGGSEHYNKGWENGENHPPQKEDDNSSKKTSWW
jgi:hypothetical protein